MKQWIQTAWWISALSSKSVDARMRAAKQLGGLTFAPKIIEALTRALTDAEPAVRCAVVAAFGKGADGSLCDPLLRALASDGDPNVRVEIVNAIAKHSIRPTIFEALTRSLGDTDSVVRAAAAKAIGEAGGQNSQSALLRALAVDDDPNVQTVIVNTLASHCSPSSIEGLVLSLTKQGSDLSRPKEDREIALRALAAIGDASGLKYLFISSIAGDLKTEANNAFKSAKNWPNVDVLLSATEDVDVHVREGALKLLTQTVRLLADRSQNHDALATNALVKILHMRLADPDIEPLPDILRRLKGVSDPVFIAPLLQILFISHRWSKRRGETSDLTHIHAQIVSNAVDRLCGFKDARVFDALSDVLMSNEDGTVSARAARALTGVRTENAIRALIHVLSLHSFVDARIAAAEALGLVNDPPAFLALIHALTDKSEKVRRSAAQALGKHKNDQAVEPLAAALNDKDYWVCNAALAALTEMGSRAALAAIEADRRRDEIAEGRKAEADRRAREELELLRSQLPPIRLPNNAVGRYARDIILDLRERGSEPFVCDNIITPTAELVIAQADGLRSIANSLSAQLLMIGGSSLSDTRQEMLDELVAIGVVASFTTDWRSRVDFTPTTSSSPRFVLTQKGLLADLYFV